MQPGNHLKDRQLRDRSKGVGMQFEACRTGLCPFQVDILEEKFDDFTYSRRTVNVRNDL